MNTIEQLELANSHFQTVVKTNIDKTFLGINWVRISLEKIKDREEKAVIKKWMV
jgi:hypothetical protein